MRVGGFGLRCCADRPPAPEFAVEPAPHCLFAHWLWLEFVAQLLLNQARLELGLLLAPPMCWFDLRLGEPVLPTLPTLSGLVFAFLTILLIGPAIEANAVQFAGDLPPRSEFQLLI